MNKQIPSYLKLVSETATETAPELPEDELALAGLRQAFEQATGWRLEFDTNRTQHAQANLMWSAPVNPGVGASPGHIRLFSLAAQNLASACVPLDAASALAGSIGQIWGELVGARRAVRAREAELASGGPLALRRDDQGLATSQRLEGVLRAGAEAIGCQAAGLYLLDSATTELKLCASWGLPERRLIDSARPLRGALADLEALLGHAVVLNDATLHAHWKVPESGFGSCVCVPVSSPSMPLGTLWVYCRDSRDFSPSETNILEVVAGRLAGDLERGVLVDEALSAREVSRQLNAAERQQQEQLPVVAPQVEGWDIAARAYQAGALGGAFYDWFALGGGRLAVLAGNSLQRGVAGALCAASLRAAARSFSAVPTACHPLLENANSVLWTGSAGSAGAGLFQAIVEPKAASLMLAASGPLLVRSITRGKSMRIETSSLALGQQERIELSDVRTKLAAGELLLVYGTSRLADDGQPAGLEELEDDLAQALQASLDLSAAKLAEIAGSLVHKHPSASGADCVVAVIKRRR